MAKSTYLDNALLNAVLVNTAYTSPATVYVALYTATPGPSGGGTEVSGNSYARTACTFSAASSGSITNSADCTFPAGDRSMGHDCLFWRLRRGNRWQPPLLRLPDRFEDHQLGRPA